MHLPRIGLVAHRRPSEQRRIFLSPTCGKPICDHVVATPAPQPLDSNLPVQVEVGFKPLHLCRWQIDARCAAFACFQSHTEVGSCFCRPKIPDGFKHVAEVEAIDPFNGYAFRRVKAGIERQGHPNRAPTVPERKQRSRNEPKHLIQPTTWAIVSTNGRPFGKRRFIGLDGEQMGFLNSKVVKKAHTRRIKTAGGIKTIKVKAATKGSVATNKFKKKN